MITEADRAAIQIMAHAIEAMVTHGEGATFERFAAVKTLTHAIRHLAYPDRDIYPKVRHARKTDRSPRLWRSGDDLR